MTLGCTRPDSTSAEHVRNPAASLPSFVVAARRRGFRKSGHTTDGPKKRGLILETCCRYRQFTVLVSYSICTVGASAVGYTFWHFTCPHSRPDAGEGEDERAGERATE